MMKRTSHSSFNSESDTLIWKEGAHVQWEIKKTSLFNRWRNTPTNTIAIIIFLITAENKVHINNSINVRTNLNHKKRPQPTVPTSNALQIVFTLDFARVILNKWRTRHMFPHNFTPLSRPWRQLSTLKKNQPGSTKNEYIRMRDTFNTYRFSRAFSTVRLIRKFERSIFYPII